MTFLKKILLIDPEPCSTAAVRDALERSGRFLVKEEHDSRCAVSAARWFQPDLILVDLFGASPEMASRLQHESSFGDVPVLFVTGGSAGDDRVISTGVLSGYTFFANAVGQGEFVRWITELLLPARD